MGMRMKLGRNLHRGWGWIGEDVEEEEEEGERRTEGKRKYE
jgi:hypothetical protein